MKTIKILSQGEIFYLYWNGKKQPCGVTKQAIIEYIGNDIFGNLTAYKVVSNYRANVELSEILN